MQENNRQEKKLPDLKKINDAEWIIEKGYKKGMNVPAKIFATEELIKDMDYSVFDQITNVASLPGIINYAYCMSDAHSGYGFPIGGVAAFDAETGIISPGGIGFDINCGMRLVLTNLTIDQVQPKLRTLIDTLFKKIPAGVGGKGILRLEEKDFRELVEKGSKWCVEKGYGWEDDLEKTEEHGCMEGADSKKCSQKAISRGLNQVGTLGSGNHYLEIQVVKEENIYDKEAAKKLGIFPNQVVVMFHCGSRGFGHQVASDYLQSFLKVMEPKYNLKILDRELSCAPFKSQDGQDYFSAMKCAVNMAFANRQVILHRIREVFSEIFGKDAKDLGMKMVYDVAHNIAKLEKHIVDGEEREVLVHRKGATRAFGPGRVEVPEVYRDLGQPVIIGGSMETGSYLLLGTKEAENMTFGSTAHGAGRAMSRAQAKRQWHGKTLQKDLEKKGIYIKTTSFQGLAEEAGGAYKDIDKVIKSTKLAGLSKPVVKLLPIGNIKG